MPSFSRMLISSLVVTACVTSYAWATVIVRFDPLDDRRNQGDVFTINIVADISDPVVGWGLDLTIDDPTIISQVGFPSIGSSWLAGSTPDGDGLAGAAPATALGERRQELGGGGPLAVLGRPSGAQDRPRRASHGLGVLLRRGGVL